MVVQHYVNFWNGADVLDKQLIPWRREDEKNRFIFNRAAMTNLSFRHSFLLLKELLISLSEIAAAIKKKSSFWRIYFSVANNPRTPVEPNTQRQEGMCKCVLFQEVLFFHIVKNNGCHASVIIQILIYQKANWLHENKVHNGKWSEVTPVFIRASWNTACFTTACTDFCCFKWEQYINTPNGYSWMLQFQTPQEHRNLYSLKIGIILLTEFKKVFPPLTSGIHKDDEASCCW